MEAAWSAEDYAAEAMASDMDRWITFDARDTPRERFSSWFQSNRPSRVSRLGGQQEGEGPVGWISVLGPGYSKGEGDVAGLLDGWAGLLERGDPVTFHTLRQLALDHGVLAGKWLIHMDTGFKVDRAWEGVAAAVLDGKVLCAKVSPRDPGSDKRHIICVYNSDFTDEAQVRALEEVIRVSGVKCPLLYKPDVYTHLGIYRNNRWRLCPTIYQSSVQLRDVPRRSRVLSRVTGNKELEK